MNRLTEKQRRELKAVLKDTISTTVRDAVSAQVASLKSQAGPSYSDRAQAGSQAGAGSSRKELSETARIFGSFGLIAVASQGDRAAGLDLAKILDVENHYRKALSAGQGEAGGALVMEGFGDLIPLLSPFSVVRRIGVTEVPLSRGNLRSPRLDVATSAAFVAEGQQIPAVDLKTGSVNLVARKLAAIAAASNELLTFTSEQGGLLAAQVLSDEMVRANGQREDVAFLFGSGSEAEPLGITKQAAAANIINANATVNVANVVKDLQKLMGALTNNDVPMIRPVWIWSPRTSNFLMTLLDNNNNFVFRREIENGRLFRWPFFETNNVPNDGGTGNDESSIIVADASEIMVGDVDGVAIDRSNDASIMIDGVRTSLFDTDRFALRVRRWTDIRVKHDVSVAVLQKVKWGA